MEIYYIIHMIFTWNNNTDMSCRRQLVTSAEEDEENETSGEKIKWKIVDLEDYNIVIPWY